MIKKLFKDGEVIFIAIAVVIVLVVGAIELGVDIESPAIEPNNKTCELL